MTLKKKILHHLSEVFPGAVHKGEMEKMAIEWGCLSETINRECRKMVSGGEILKISDGGKSIKYKLNREEDLNTALDNLLKNIRVTWENQSVLDEIIRAKKSDNVYFKRSTLDKYRKLM